MHDIHPPITPETVATLAYRLWEEAGRPENRDQEFWFTAEHRLGSLTNNTSAKAASDLSSTPPRAPRKRRN